MPVLWEQWDEEPPKAFAAFTTFRDLTPSTRSLPNAYRAGTGDPTKEKVSGQWRRWAKAYAWHTRAAAYDQHLDALRRKATEKELALQTRKQVRQIEISARAALEENAALAHSNIADVASWDAEGNVTIKPSEDLPPHVTAAISKIKKTHDKAGNPQIEVEMHPKVRPIDLEGQHFKLWDSDKKQAEAAATNSFLELLATIKSGKLDEMADRLNPSLLNPPPGITITRDAPMTIDDLDEVIEKDENISVCNVVVFHITK